jgi:hypothetical protein
LSHAVRRGAASPASRKQSSCADARGTHWRRRTHIVGGVLSAPSRQLLFERRERPDAWPSSRPKVVCRLRPLRPRTFGYSCPLQRTRIPNDIRGARLLPSFAVRSARRGYARAAWSAILAVLFRAVRTAPQTNAPTLEYRVVMRRARMLTCCASRECRLLALVQRSGCARTARRPAASCVPGERGLVGPSPCVWCRVDRATRTGRDTRERQLPGRSRSVGVGTRLRRRRRELARGESWNAM